jgi:hypothetical protein
MHGPTCTFWANLTPFCSLKGKENLTSLIEAKTVPTAAEKHREKERERERERESQ